MIIVDTNVLSEPLRRTPDPAVLAWLSAHRAELVLTSIVVGELRYGVLKLPDGARRRKLAAAIDTMVRVAGGTVLAYDVPAAESYAALRSSREAAGRRVEDADVMIAAVAACHGCGVATRNVAHFEGFGVEIINPWEWSGT